VTRDSVLWRNLDIIEGMMEVGKCPRCGQPNRRQPQRLCHDCHASSMRLARAIAIANRRPK
jgi:NMD protein affecting ribosome stability and mRNA decay